MKPYIIYRVLNLVTRKFYIGRTTSSIKKRWSVHVSHSRYYKRYHKHRANPECCYLARSIRKYGPEVFEIREIDRAKDHQHMVWLEAFYIRYYDAINAKHGYNLIIDKYGEGREFTSDETKLKIALSSHLKNAPCGVIWDTGRNKWSLRFWHLGTKITKRFDVEKDAKQTWDRLALYAFGEKAKLHYPELRTWYQEEDLSTFYEKIKTKRVTKSRYRGITKQGDRYDARIQLSDKNRLFLGLYSSEVETAIVYDKVATYLGHPREKLNIPELWSEAYVTEGELIYKERTNPRKQRFIKDKTSQFRGVNKRSTHTWEMSLSFDDERVREVHATETSAALAFDYNVRRLGLNLNWLNFPDQVVDIPPSPLPIKKRRSKNKEGVDAPLTPIRLT